MGPSSASFSRICSLSKHRHLFILMSVTTSICHCMCNLTISSCLVTFPFVSSSPCQGSVSSNIAKLKHGIYFLVSMFSLADGNFANSYVRYLIKITYQFFFLVPDRDRTTLLNPFTGPQWLSY